MLERWPQVYRVSIKFALRLHYGAKLEEGTSRAERTIQVMVEARQHQNGSERGSRFMLGSQRSHCHNKTNSGVVDSNEGVGWKG